MEGFGASRWEDGVEVVKIFGALSCLQHGRELQAPEAASNTLISLGINFSPEATIVLHVTLDISIPAPDFIFDKNRIVILYPCQY